VELCVFADPRVAVVDVGSGDVFVGHVGKNHEPFLEKLCAEPKSKSVSVY